MEKYGIEKIRITIYIKKQTNKNNKITGYKKKFWLMWKSIVLIISILSWYSDYQIGAIESDY